MSIIACFHTVTYSRCTWRWGWNNDHSHFKPESVRCEWNSIECQRFQWHLPAKSINHDWFSISYCFSTTYNVLFASENESYYFAGDTTRWSAMEKNSSTFYSFASWNCPRYWFTHRIATFATPKAHWFPALWLALPAFGTKTHRCT